jgi:hypothetical protein
LIERGSDPRGLSVVDRVTAPAVPSCRPVEQQVPSLGFAVLLERFLTVGH